MEIHCLTHVPFEDAANIGRWAKDRGHSLSYTYLFRNKALPQIESFDMLAIMGGLMNVYEYDAYPWLVSEKVFIQKAINAGKKIIGVCLGGQLIADVLGGNVMPNREKEIGWYPITLTEEGQTSRIFSGLPKVMDVFQWHGDTFSTPPGAIHLATSSACENQAFLYGRGVLGLQFHLEYSQESIEKMLTHCANEIVPAPYINTVDVIRKKYDKIPATTEWLYILLDNFASF
ncbi:MAG: type 1 glutamine amidotransferase [Planctomycetes bacterium]|nr:type 1 glutamine amidotransferase [Planctomycetota bacterium]